MPTLTDEWKLAKKAFQDKTNKKKPSPKLLGLINKGTGIEASLAKADSADTAKDVRAALDKFETDATAYTKMLKAAASDQSAVPAKDKADYLSAVTALDVALVKLLAIGAAMAAHLEQAADPVPTNVSKAKDEIAVRELTFHLTLRKKMPSFCGHDLENYKKMAAMVSAAADDAATQTAIAKKQKAANDVNVKATIDLVNRAVAKAEMCFSAAKKDWDNSQTGVDLKNARTDIKTPFPESWSIQQRSAYAKESETALNLIESILKQSGALVHDMESKVKKAQQAAAEAATYMIKAWAPAK